VTPQRFLGAGSSRGGSDQWRPAGSRIRCKTNSGQVGRHGVGGRGGVRSGSGRDYISGREQWRGEQRRGEGRVHYSACVQYRE
jgi:hypothetical protein